MLLSLSIDNFATIDHLEVTFHPSFNVITGESGAGKSIILAALGLALGERADAHKMRTAKQRADIHAHFSLQHCPNARAYLAEQAWLNDDECLIRRIITPEGRSKASINGYPVTQLQLKTLASKLLDICGQHAHYSLLKKDYQRQLLDDYAELTLAVAELNQRVKAYQAQQQQLAELEAQQAQGGDRLALVQYQLDELITLALQTDEWEALNKEQAQLVNADSSLHNTQAILTLCQTGEPNALSYLQQALQHLKSITTDASLVAEIEPLLQTAVIHIEEANSTLQGYSERITLNPQRLQEVEERLKAIYDTARKHRVTPQQLPAIQQQLKEEQLQLNHIDEQIHAMQQQLAEYAVVYQAQAKIISQQRARAAKTLQDAVNERLASLAMAHCHFSIALTPKAEQPLALYGNETIDYLMSPHPKQAAQALSRLASGGELSRIGLAIQVACAQTSVLPTLVFDEVDVGIGGATTDAVGKLLRKLGENTQILCITHQAALAAKGQHHVLVCKRINDEGTVTEVQLLADHERVEEIARMLSGSSTTQRGKEHAIEMLEQSL